MVQLNAYLATSMGSFRAHNNEQSSFRFVIDSFGKSLDWETQRGIIERFHWMPWQGRVSLKHADEQYYIIADHGLRAHMQLHPHPPRRADLADAESSSSSLSSAPVAANTNSEPVSILPPCYHFGRLIAEGTMAPVESL
jgi:hypothetical protein